MKPLFDYAHLTPKTSSDTPLSGKDVLSVGQFDKDTLNHIFARAREMREVVQKVGTVDLLKGYVLGCIFYEPSTRTSSSFIAAMQRLGGSVIPITSGVQFSSVSKGETLGDTMRTLQQYADVIVLRHPVIGAAKEAAAAADVPILNAGDGAGQRV